MFKLNDSHQKQFQAFIYQKPISNLFFIGDYLSYGFNHRDCDFYAVIEEQKITTCMMRYHDRVHLSGEALEHDAEVFFHQFILKNNIRGINFGIDFEPLIKRFPFEVSVDKTALSVYEPKDLVQVEDVLALKLDEVSAFARVQDRVFEMETNEAVLIENLIRQRLQCFVYKKADEIVSIASATAFTPDAAMIIGVGTLPEHRGQGFATKCVQALSNDLYANGRQAVLFYSNPVAGKMYHKLGFVDKEVYYLLTIEKGASNENN